jgi:hypothetical protein
MGVRSQHHALAVCSLEISGTHFTGGWVSRGAGLDELGITRPQQESIPGPSSP